MYALANLDAIGTMVAPVVRDVEQGLAVAAREGAV